MINEAVILAGGFGTRLQTVVSDIPKPMAEVNNKPFLEYVLNYLLKFNIKNIVLSVGYKHNVIIDYFGNNFKGININYAIESEPLGTGGAIKFAANKIHSKDFFLLNGDTLFDVNLNELSKFHKNLNSDISLSLKPMKGIDRYGVVEFDNNFKINNFKEKKYQKSGYINGGVYAINKNVLEKTDKKKFSFEKDIMEKYLSKINIFAYISDTYFIDIGIPEDYKKANYDLKNM